MDDKLSGFTHSVRTKRRRIKAMVEEYVRAAVDSESVTAENNDFRVIANSESPVYFQYDQVSCVIDSSGGQPIAGGDENMERLFCFQNDSPVDIVEDSYRATDSETDDEDSNVEGCRPEDLKTQLAQWATSYGIAHVALSDLLAILNQYNIDVPKDARTLLSTPRVVDVKKVAGGLYHHRGIKNGIICSFQEKLQELEEDTLTLNINIDGLPLFKSSSCQLWPILGIVSEFRKSGPFLIGLFSGNSKPSSVDEYLSDFVIEMKAIMDCGFLFCGRTFYVKLGAFVCDAPARAFVKCIKGHTGYNACERCKQEGVYLKGRMSFSESSCVDRTDCEFECMSSEEHHIGTTPLLKLGVGCVTQFPLDYMHLVCLGVVRRLILLWMKGPLTCRIGNHAVQSISGELLMMKPHMPREFARKPRTLSDVLHWKATEFRQFLLYTGPVVLKNFLQPDVYRNFMTLSVAITFLLSPTLCQKYYDYAKQLLSVFIKNFKMIYGAEFVSYNIHGLVHLADDACKFGPLDRVSSFPFENYLGKIKKMVRKSQNPLVQVVKRIHEKGEFKGFELVYENKLMKMHANGPLPSGLVGYSQYQQYVSSDMVVSCSYGNNCFEICGKISLIKNIIQSPDGIISVMFDTFKSVQPYFEYPLNSLPLGISIVSQLSGKYQQASLQAVSKKFVLLPVKEHFVAMPLLHC